jgi:hypothetical protein
VKPALATEIQMLISYHKLQPPATTTILALLDGVVDSE